MPVYPCLKCNSPVDPNCDRVCKNCREAQPLECSRCSRRIATEEVFERDKLKTKKPIFCLECGEREEVVKCALCKLSLQRHSAKQVSMAPGAKLYHPHCLNDRQRQMEKISASRPLMALAGLVVGGLLGWSQTGTSVGGGIGAIVGAVALFGFVYAMTEQMTPR